MTHTFYNTGGTYYNSEGSSDTASSAYYCKSGRRFRMNITAAQMAEITGSITSVQLHTFVTSIYNSTFKCWAAASKSNSWSTALTDGNYFGQTDTYTTTMYPRFSEQIFDVTSCFQYAQENWTGEAWYLWFKWTQGDDDATLGGYNYSDASYRPYFVVTYEDATTVCYIKPSGTWLEAIPYIKDGSTWVQATPYVKSGSTWTS